MNWLMESMEIWYMCKAQYVSTDLHSVKGDWSINRPFTTVKFPWIFIFQFFEDSPELVIEYSYNFSLTFNLNVLL